MKRLFSLVLRINLLVVSQGLLWQPALLAQQQDGTCFMVTDSGSLVGLDHLCGQAQQEGTQEGEPVTIAEVQELFDRGFAFGRARQYDEALEVFSEAIRLNPTYAEAYVGRAVIQVSRKDFQEAVNDYRRAAQIARDRGEIERAALLDSVIERYEGML